jgi:hypothetical protein
VLLSSSRTSKIFPFTFLRLQSSMKFSSLPFVLHFQSVFHSEDNIL